MGEGLQYFDWLYDLEATVKETNPDQLLQDVNGVKPTKYFTIDDSGKVFPKRYLADEGGLLVVRKSELTDPHFDPNDDYLEAGKADEVGSVVPVTLVYRTALAETKEGASYVNMTWGDEVEMINNQLMFNAGRLEELLAHTKQRFVDLAVESGIQIDATKVYNRLVLE